VKIAIFLKATCRINVFSTKIPMTLFTENRKPIQIYLQAPKTQIREKTASSANGAGETR
jgi:hypothetical protein